jgi:glutamate-1-semialdehyde 2,1-aminomutase
MRSMDTSVELSRRALEVMPGPHSNLPGYELFKPIYLVRGDKAHLYDVDGNEFIDYMSGLGAGILGYGNQEFVEAIKKQMDTMYFLDAARRNPLEIELAEKIIQHVPCAEKVRYLLSGTEACQMVIRLARAYTGRNLFVRFNGHYHGWLDNVMGGYVNPDPDAIPYALYPENDMFGTKGKDLESTKQSFKLKWNDIESLERVVEKYGEQIAAIAMEPINCNAGSCPPKPGYLERVRELCDQYGIVLWFDEIITGFRVSIGGAQAVLGVTPDIATFGKGIAGGIPFSAVAGKKEIMDLCTDRTVVGAGTFNGYPLGVAAALACIKILEKDNGAFYQRLDEVQGRLMSGLREVAKRHSTPMCLSATRGVLFYLFIDKEAIYSVEDWADSDAARQERLRQYLFDNGALTLFRGRWFLNGGLTFADVDKTLEMVDSAFKVI